MFRARAPPLASPAPWNVLVEAVAPMAAPSPEKLLYEGPRSALETGLVADAAIAASEAQAESFWRLRDSISEAEKKDGPAAKHDISVPVEAMAGFTTSAAAAVEARFPGTRVNAFGHLGDGNVHFNVRAPEGAGAGLAGIDRGGGQRLRPRSGHAGRRLDLRRARHRPDEDRRACPPRRSGPPQRDAGDQAGARPGGIMNPGKLVPLAP